MWNKEEIQKFIDKTPHWYQTHDFGNGLKTPGDIDSSRKLECFQWDASFEGKSFLDIGCNSGFFVFQAAKRGAKFAMGIDPNAGLVHTAEEIRDNVYGFDSTAVQFYQLRAEDLMKLPVDKFDVILISSILHHTPRFLEVIELIREKSSDEVQWATLVTDDFGESMPMFGIDYIGTRQVLLPNKRGFLEVLRYYFDEAELVGPSYHPDQKSRWVFKSYVRKEKSLPKTPAAPPQ